MLTMNSWPAVGLCNGATETVINFIYKNNYQPHDLSIAVIVKFDNYRGPSLSGTYILCANMHSHGFSTVI